MAADTVTVKYLWPPGFDGNPPGPGQKGWKRVRVQMTGVSDGTGESAVKKIDLSESGGLRRPDGQPVVRTAVEKIEYSIFGFTSIKLEWDRTPKETIAVLTETGNPIDYTQSGGLVEQSDGLNDRTGDILLTSAGATSGDSYNIVLSLLLM